MTIIRGRRRNPESPHGRLGAGIALPAGLRLQQKPARRTAGYAIAVLGVALLAGVFVPLRDSLTPVSEGFAFVTLVVAASWIGGFGPGVVASFLAFLTFNFFFLPPYNTFIIERPEYIVVLFVMLGISVVISLLLARARERADAAESREAELVALQELSRELVVRAPGNEAYEAVLQRLIQLLALGAASLWVRDSDTPEGLREVSVAGAGAGTLVPSASGGERIPLSVGRNNLGMLVIEAAGRRLSPGASRVLRAFSDQLALVLERDRLLHVAAKAESYRATEKLRRALLTAVSHDLRSPLSAIKTSVTDLLDSTAPSDPAYAHESLESIDKEVDRLNLLIANLLDMSRIESGMLRARVQPVDVADVAAQAVGVAQRRWPGIRFSTSIEDRAAVVQADPVFLDRIVTNLLDNAARSTVEAGTIDVDLQARRGDNGTAVIRIVDHGKGVSPAAREHLFHAFFDLDERSPRLGNGLGLAICKGFVSSMDGDIWAEETPGGGATFAVALAAGTQP